MFIISCAPSFETFLGPPLRHIIYKKIYKKKTTENVFKYDERNTNNNLNISHCSIRCYCMLRLATRYTIIIHIVRSKSGSTSVTELLQFLVSTNHVVFSFYCDLNPFTSCIISSYIVNVCICHQMTFLCTLYCTLLVHLCIFVFAYIHVLFCFCTPTTQPGVLIFTIYLYFHMSHVLC